MWELTAATSWLALAAGDRLSAGPHERHYASCVAATALACSRSWQPHTQGSKVNKSALIALLSVLLLATQVQAQDDAAALEKFRAAYTAGKGLSYVVVPGDKGERL